MIARPPRQSPDRDRGSVTLFTVVLAFGLFLLAGLVVDGGEKLTAARRASDIAEQAARTGAQAVSVPALRSTGRVGLDQASAREAATAYLADNGLRGTVRIEGDQITVTTTVSRPTVILGLVGIERVTASGSGTAELITGITQAGPP